MLTRRIFLFGAAGSAALALLPDRAAAEPSPTPSATLGGGAPYPSTELFPGDDLHPEV